MRRGPDRKSEFLRALKDEVTGELTTSSSPGTSGEVGSSLAYFLKPSHMTAQLLQVMTECAVACQSPVKL